MSEMWQRLRAARRRAQMTQAEVAEFFGMRPPSVTMWERPSNDRGSKQTRPNLNKISRLAALFELPPNYLLDDAVEVVDLGEGEFEFAVEPPSNGIANSAGVETQQFAYSGVAVKGESLKVNESNVVQDEVGRGRMVPVISWVRAGDFAEAIDNHHPGDAESWVLCRRSVKERAFALRVIGESMHNPGGDHSFGEGDIIIIDPDEPPTHRSFVVAKIPATNEVTFKQMIFEGGKAYLKALNPNWPKQIAELPDGATIIGRVVRVERGEDLI